VRQVVIQFRFLIKFDLIKTGKMEVIGKNPIFPEQVSNGKTKLLYKWKLLLKGLNPKNKESTYGKYLFNSDHYGLSAELI